MSPYYLNNNGNILILAILFAVAGYTLGFFINALSNKLYAGKFINRVPFSNAGKKFIYNFSDKPKYIIKLL